MRIVLLSIAGTLVGLALFIFIAWWWIRRKLRGLVEGLADAVDGFGGTVPPFRITLTPTAESEWKDAATIDAVSKILEQAGYAQAGDFHIPEQSDLVLRGFCNPEASTYGAIYENPVTEKAVIDVVCDLADGMELTVSNVPDEGLSRPDHAPISRIVLDARNDPEGVIQLHDTLIADRGDRPAEPASVEAFSSAFTNAYAREMDWRIERGGVTEDEIRASAGDGEETDVLAIELFQGMWRDSIAEFVDEQIHDAYLASDPMTASEWEDRRDRILLVHEYKEAAVLVEELAWSLLEDEDDEDDEDDDDEAGEQALEQAKTTLQDAFDRATSVREGFASAQALLPEAMRYEKIGVVDGRYASDVYLQPEDEFDVED